MDARPNNIIIGIAGGSGSGKSTLAIGLCKKYPETFTLVHIDDYFKKKEEAPQLNGFTNWDHPEALRLDDVYQDLLSLRSGKAITTLTKSELYHPAYDPALRNKIEYVIEPKPIIILEGYLAFCEQKLRDLMELKMYLDISITESTKRRSTNKFSLGPDYFSNVLEPMFAKFVQPTKQYADVVIEVYDKAPEEVLALAEDKILQNTETQ